MIWSSLIGLAGNIAGGIFGLKKKQGDIIQQSLKTLDGVNASDAAYFDASAKAVEAVYRNGGWLERGWRPALMWMAIGLIGARYFGYEPPGMTPTEIDHLYQFIYIGLGGYMPLRSLDKWMHGLQVGSVLKKFIEKKIL